MFNILCTDDLDSDASLNVFNTFYTAI